MKAFLIKFKELFFALALALTISFMFFIVEPITLYANNINDFWFDLPTIFPSLMLFFGICSITIFTTLSIFYIISRLTKKPLIFQIAFIITFVGFFIAYIHGNFFSSALPAFDGETIHWRDYITEHIISAIICAIIIAAAIFTSIKFKPAKITKIATGITLAILAMLSTSLISTLLTTDATKEKEVMTYATDAQINTYSSDKNFLIFLVDATDSERFYKATSSLPLYKETFKDFTYFPDTVGAYNLTRDAIPFIFSGIWDRNETDFVTYSTNAYNSSPLFEKLKSENYVMNFYDSDFVWHNRKALEFSNITNHTKDLYKTNFLKQLIKYDLFKCLPYPLKKFSRANSINFADTQSLNETPIFDWSNIKYYNNTKENSVNLTDKKLFQFLHLEGAHVPYNLDEDLNIIENGTYNQKCIATLKVINAYLNHLKKAGAYDNSAIIIMADHGANNIANPNPILYIKGIGEHHDYASSSKAIWYPDLLNAYNELLAGEPSSKIFSNVAEEHRDRYIIQIPYQHEEHMTEWVQTDKAWNADTLKMTGKEFNL